MFCRIKLIVCVATYTIATYLLPVFVRWIGNCDKMGKRDQLKTGIFLTPFPVVKSNSWWVYRQILNVGKTCALVRKNDPLLYWKASSDILYLISYEYDKLSNWTIPLGRIKSPTAY